MNVNTLSGIALVKGFLPQMIKLKNQGGAQIVNIVSIAGQIGTAMRTFYCTSKFAQDGFGKALQAEVAHHGITVT